MFGTKSFKIDTDQRDESQNRQDNAPEPEDAAKSDKVNGIEGILEIGKLSEETFQLLDIFCRRE